MTTPLRFTRSVFLLIILISVAGCEKLGFDYRKKYEGEWNFTTNYTDYFISGLVLDADTVRYKGSIIAGASDNEIVIYFTESKCFTVVLEKDGDIPNTEWGVYDYFGGKFVDKHTFRFTSNSGDLSHRHKYEISGKR